MNVAKRKYKKRKKVKEGDKAYNPNEAKNKAIAMARKMKKLRAKKKAPKPKNLKIKIKMNITEPKATKKKATKPKAKSTKTKNKGATARAKIRKTYKTKKYGSADYKKSTTKGIKCWKAGPKVICAPRSNFNTSKNKFKIAEGKKKVKKEDNRYKGAPKKSDKDKAKAKKKRNLKATPKSISGKVAQMKKIYTKPQIAKLKKQYGVKTMTGLAKIIM